jgi:hypothetical protein
VLPEAAVPVLSNSFPEMPADSAFDDLIMISPLDAYVLSPLTTARDPPALFTADVPPALIITDAPAA